MYRVGVNGSPIVNHTLRISWSRDGWCHVTLKGQSWTQISPVCFIRRHHRQAILPIPSMPLFHGHWKQESLANAKVSARQQCVYDAPRNLRQIDARNIILKSRFSGLQRYPCQYGFTFIRLAVVAWQICEITWNSLKIRTYSSSRSSKVIDLGAKWKSIYNFLLMIISNPARISCHFRGIDAFSSNISCFHHSAFVLRPLAEKTLCYQHNLYTAPLKIHLSGLQLRRWQYESIFTRLAVVGQRICKILRNSERVRHCSISRPSKVIDLGANRKSIYNFSH